MKKIILFTGIFLLTVNLLGQTGTGWAQQRAKMNFKDTTSFAKSPRTNLAEADYVIEKGGSVYYARPRAGTTLPDFYGAAVTPVLQDAIDELTSGGHIHIKADTYSDMDSIVISNDNITISGEGRYNTILRLKASFDVGKTVSDGFIQVIEKDNFTIMDLEIDGNGANQTKIDDGASAGLAIICGVESEDTRYLTIDNCYIHDFTETGIFSSGCDFLTVKNSHIKDNYWNGITFGWGTDFNVVENCLVEGGGDVGVALYGRTNKVLNSTIRYVTGTHGFNNSQVSISLEVAGDGPYVRSQYHQIVNNMIKGAGQNAGIVSNAIGEGSLGVTIQGNYIDSCGIAISMMGDSSLIANNKIVNPQGESYNYGIYIQDGDYNFVTGNDITCRTIGTSDYPILLTNTSDGADYNKIVNNNLFGGTYYSIGVGHANCDGNYIAGNIFNDSQGGATDIYDVGTGTIKTYDNYDYNSARFNPIVTGSNRTVNYTGDGSSVNFGAADLTTTGTGTVGVLKVGDAASATILSADSISTDGTTFLVFDGATQLSPNIPASGQGELSDYVPLLVDTIPLFVFGGGGGNDGDSTVFTTSTVYGSFFNAGSDTLVVTELRACMTPVDGSDTLDVDILWDVNLNDASPTKLNTTPLPVNSSTTGTVDTVFDDAKIPPGVWVWCETPAVIVGRKPTLLIVQLSGYKIPKY